MAVLSDLHAATEAPDRTWVREGADSATNPLSGLQKLVENTPELRADLLLCPGDLCDQADWAALPYAWAEVQAFARRIEASEVIATVGNHDIDSRRTHGDDRIQQGLLDLGSTFPSHPGGDRAEFWERRITQVTGPEWQVISLNSSLMRELQGDERDHGEIAPEVLEAIREAAANVEVPVNVLLCHHHPQPITGLTPEDQSHMQAGDQLVELLNDLPQAWMIVHGHRHQPHLSYMDGAAAAPTRLAAGSAGAILWPNLSLHVRNQLHLIEFEVSKSAELDLEMAGHVRSWTWQYATEWRRAHAKGDGLPGLAGFGYRMGGPALARRLTRFGTEQGKEVFERADLAAWEPRLEYLHPHDLAQFQDHLEHQLGCRISFNRLGEIERVVTPG